MSISNGSAILQADISALTTATLALLRADNAGLPLLVELPFFFRNLRASGPATPDYARRARFIAPRDLWLEAIALGVFGMNGTTTATLGQTTTATALAFTPASVSVVGAGAGASASGARTLYDNTRGATSSTARLEANPVFRCIPKGVPMTLQMTTTNTLTSEHAWVTLVCREGYARP